MNDQNTQHLPYWLALIRTPGISYATVQKLLNFVPDVKAIFDLDTNTLRQLGCSQKLCEMLAQPDWHAIERDLDWLGGEGRYLITFKDARYPELLRCIPQPPIALFCYGCFKALNQPQVAIVGSRNPTPTGRETAFYFSKHLAEAGFVITSGLARGIDGAAHRGALAHNLETIAVMGCGLEHVYPAKHKKLVESIVSHGGAIVSEFPLSTPPLPNHFPQRNRIISGLVLGVLVVEATRRSGSLITAYQGIEQGREVFAIPGSIHSPLSRGCHQLISEGAKLVETTKDIIEELGTLSQVNSESDPTVFEEKMKMAYSHKERQLLACIGEAPTSIDQLVERSGLSTETVASMLLKFELDHCVESVAGGYCRKRYKPVGLIEEH